jgi:hypothetical protein
MLQRLLAAAVMMLPASVSDSAGELPAVLQIASNFDTELLCIAFYFQTQLCLLFNVK